MYDQFRKIIYTKPMGIPYEEIICIKDSEVDDQWKPIAAKYESGPWVPFVGGIQHWETLPGPEGVEITEEGYNTPVELTRTTRELLREEALEVILRMDGRDPEQILLRTPPERTP